MTRSCKTCAQSFEITPEDFAFYEQMQVPPPTLCSECRMVRRMLQFNERGLFKGVCKLCGKSVITSHHPDVPYPIYCQPCWWSDSWDVMAYGREYDLSRGFFEQFKELRDVVPLPALNNIYSSNVNSEYVNMCSYVKNCYLCFNSDFNEECAYTDYLEQSKRCYDVDNSLFAEQCYGSVGLFKSYRVRYGSNIEESMDIWFSMDLKNCINCFGCINLRSKSYCWFNEQKTKEEYVAELAKYDLTSREVIDALKKKAAAFFLTQPHKFIRGVNNKNVTGDYIFNSKNITDCFDIVDSEDCKYCHFFIIEGSKNCMDVTMWGSHLMQAYECCGVGNHQNNVIGCGDSWNEASNLAYCRYILAPNSDLFGCIGTRNKKYCILNKQYTKEEYEALRAKIIAKMKADGEWGEFFPTSMSLIGYNESFANKYRPLSKEQALAKGFRWSEPEKRDYTIGGDVIACEHAGSCMHQCSTAFKLTPNEKDFYQAMTIPTPHLCPNCRHYERLSTRNPIGLYARNCAKCGTALETSFAPNRPEVVYCDDCYQHAVL